MGQNFQGPGRIALRTIDHIERAGQLCQFLSISLAYDTDSNLACSRMYYRDAKMNFRMIDAEIVDLVFAEFPEFAGSEDFRGEGPYMVLGSFALYLQDGMGSNSLSEEIVEGAFRLLNDWGACAGGDIQDLICWGVFEILIDENHAVDACRDKLNGRALELFEITQKFWQTEWP
jgi:hypothetical protein